MDKLDLSRVLSLIIGLLTDPYDKFIEKLQAEGRVTDEEVQTLRQALKDQIPKLSKLVRRQPSDNQVI